MRRIQGNFGSRDPDDEKKKIREAVLANFALFGAFVVVIKLVPYVAQNF